MKDFVDHASIIIYSKRDLYIYYKKNRLKRTEELEKINEKELKKMVSDSKSYTEVAKKITGLSPDGKWIKNVREEIIKRGVDTSHFTKKFSKERVADLIDKNIEELSQKYGTSKDVAKELGINYSLYNSMIQQKLEEKKISLNYEKRKRVWKKEEIDFLKNNYEWAETKILMKGIKRSWDAIKIMAEKMNIERKNLKNTKKSNLSSLLEESPEAYYWIGFLMADGHFSEKRITLTLSDKDKSHIKKFGKYIKLTSIKNYSNKCRAYVYVSSMDYKIVPKIREKFSISSRKTYDPCDISKIKNDNLFISLVIGFIDGDGCIKKQHGRKDCAISIKCHSSWLNNLQYISDRICGILGLKPNTAIINKKGYANVCFSNSIILKFLKNKSKKLKLPFLKRKWDNINLKLKNRREISKNNFSKINKMIQEGLALKEISRKLKIKYHTIYQKVNRGNKDE